jgi:hypothetical protein
VRLLGGLATCVVLALVPAGRLAAVGVPPCTISWTGGSAGFWNVATNWDLGRLPEPADHVCIPVGANVTHNTGTSTVQTVQVAGALILTGGTLTTTSTADESRVVSLVQGGGTLAGANDVVLTGSGASTSSWVGGTMSGAGTTPGGEQRCAEHQWVGGCFACQRTNARHARNSHLGDAFTNLARNARGGSLTLQGGRRMTVPGLFTNEGTLVAKAGSTFSVANGAFVNAAGGLLQGTGTIDANVGSAGEVAPGLSPGVLTIAGNYVQQSDGGLRIEIASFTPETEYDRLVVNGFATLDGRLTMSRRAASSRRSGRSSISSAGCALVSSRASKATCCRTGTGTRRSTTPRTCG